MVCIRGIEVLFPFPLCRRRATLWRSCRCWSTCRVRSGGMQRRSSDAWVAGCFSAHISSFVSAKTLRMPTLDRTSSCRCPLPRLNPKPSHRILVGLCLTQRSCGAGAIPVMGAGRDPHHRRARQLAVQVRGTLHCCPQKFIRLQPGAPSGAGPMQPLRPTARTASCTLPDHTFRCCNASSATYPMCGTGPMRRRGATSSARPGCRSALLHRPQCRCGRATTATCAATPRRPASATGSRPGAHTREKRDPKNHCLLADT